MLYKDCRPDGNATGMLDISEAVEGVYECWWEHWKDINYD